MLASPSNTWDVRLMMIRCFYQLCFRTRVTLGLVQYAHGRGLSCHRPGKGRLQARHVPRCPYDRQACNPGGGARRISDSDPLQELGSSFRQTQCRYSDPHDEGLRLSRVLLFSWAFKLNDENALETIVCLTR